VGVGPRVEVGWEGRVSGRWPDYIENFHRMMTIQ
jgi:hypothetical protein